MGLGSLPFHFGVIAKQLDKQRDTALLCNILKCSCIGFFKYTNLIFRIIIKLYVHIQCMYVSSDALL